MSVVVLSGSNSDKPIIDKITQVLDENKVEYKTFIVSAHREPELLEKILNETRERTKVYICVAGLSAALPGVVASKVTQPVIGVPVNVKLGGLDSLLSIVQMPSGVPVATVGIDNGKNAAYLAIRILNICGL